MKHKNQIIYSQDLKTLERLQEEYTMIGFDTVIKTDKVTGEKTLVIFAIPRSAKNKKLKLKYK